MRFVFKVGTALITTPDNELNTKFLSQFVKQVAAIRMRGHEVAIVTSGAVASGRSEICFVREKKNIPARHALAAIGQGILMKNYSDAFKKRGIIVAQALLTNYDCTNRENFVNTKGVFEILLKNNVVPIVNENDMTTIAELRFGNNDMLSAKVAAMIDADFLCIFTDVDGLFDKDPKSYPGAKLLCFVGKIDDSVKALAGGANSARSVGGMITKLEAAQYVMSAGISMWIANGAREGIVEDVVNACEKCRGDECKLVLGSHSIGTFFPSATSALHDRKKWILPKAKKAAWITIDEGAKRALVEKGKSLLSSGIREVHGEFKRGDVVTIKCNGEDIGCGQVNYSSASVDKIKLQQSFKIEEILGFSFEDEVIHRDFMIVFGAGKVTNGFK